MTNAIFQGRLIILVSIDAVVYSSRLSRIGEPLDISGVYVFKKDNCSKDGCFFGMHPDFSFSYLPDNEEVIITKTELGFAMRHVGWKNKMMSMEFFRNNPNVGWSTEDIMFNWISWGVQLGIGRESRRLRMFFDQAGSLIIESKYRETGLAFFVLPFTESYTHKMKLIRKDVS